MGRQLEIRATGYADAPPMVVFETVTDHTSYPAWNSAHEVVLEVEGDPSPNGLGAVRLVTGPPPESIALKEEVNHYWPPYLFGYTVTEGGPVVDHQGVIVLTERGDGTDISSHVTANFVPGVPDGPLSAALPELIQRLVADLAAEAERRAGVRSR